MSRWLTDEQVLAHQARMRGLDPPARAIAAPAAEDPHTKPAATRAPVQRKYYPVVELCMTAGLLLPVREHRFARAIGREWRFDFAWPPVRLYLEVDGGLFVEGGHNRGAYLLETMEKRNAATRLGWRGLWYSPQTLGCAVDDLKALLPKVDD